MTQVPKRAHVKSGCRTCKTRRVKCDEARPACLKCTKTGRVCEGYGIWGGGSAQGPAYETDLTSFARVSALRQYNLNIMTPQRSLHQRQAFEFFCQSQSLKISGMFKSDFWDHLLIQVSATESLVFFALAAVGSAHRAHITRRLSYAESKETLAKSYESLALTEYNKAVKEMSQIVVKEDDSSLRITIIACLLFICVEMMLGRHQVMKSHFRYGSTLLHKIQSGDQDPIDRHIVDAFGKMTMHLALLGQTSQSLVAFRHGPTYDMDVPCDDCFDTPRIASQSLDELLQAIFELMAQADDLDPFKTISHELREVAYDALTPNFASILSQNQNIFRVIDHQRSLEDGIKLCSVDEVFTVEKGGFPSLYFTALKCRVPEIRRKAIRMLPSITHTEGLANGLILSQIAHRIFILEDPQGAAKMMDDFTTLESEGCPEELVPEEARFHQMHAQLNSCS
ncbi:hypothetical protein LMH87_003101 [Akanthomyces muscarius]|uniref:Zn(2)-C6 fungal-type domain-containing protein n=1 Tax=Akanthomyces muscarius TaxID=2231603 RepID=A0A9W8Q9Q3_AKAMU|nr:hypothetical protein LMH87_003101 [Akanthomyces muscarius]KAJ4148640.1 hypothetical protein LMH87_003101 [Akanthomyces muscarius]